MTSRASSLVVASRFIEATRDSGYKSLGSALAELIDNSLEANATHVEVVIERMEGAKRSETRVSVSDNGVGMDKTTCSNAMRFGWSSRFNERNSCGRYGMGLPNASLSHARRIDIFTSCEGLTARTTYLDADEISSGRREDIPTANTVPIGEFFKVHPFKTGTTVIWRKCDRLENRYLAPLVKRLGLELGRLFRMQLWAGKLITLNGDAVKPLDPLFQRESCGLIGASEFGPELSYEVAFTNSKGKPSSSLVKVRFTELPVKKWHGLSNQEKNINGIAKGAGVSIIRAGREIDRGWYFMGHKRRENYDDWWRCEVCFEPDLDELFGVTHTKQEIHPTERLNTILTPDIERTARELNGRSRRAFVGVKSSVRKVRKSESLAVRYDNLIEPPKQAVQAIQKTVVLLRGGRGRVGGLDYRFHWGKLDQLAFYLPLLDGACLKVIMNEQHPFVRLAYSEATRRGDGPFDEARHSLELMILAAARAEVSLEQNKRTLGLSKKFRESWSNILATFLS
jgi:hypothetical protein